MLSLLTHDLLGTQTSHGKGTAGAGHVQSHLTTWGPQETCPAPGSKDIMSGGSGGGALLVEDNCLGYQIRYQRHPIAS